MRLIFIRHGDPDYVHDSLTERGWQEARLLSERISKLDVKEYFVSPLGRAKDTASFTLEKAGRTAIEQEWLKEFPVRVTKPYVENKDGIAWDWLPQVWTQRENFFDKDHWFEEEEFTSKGTKEEYLRVCGEFDKLLAKLGYVRDGYIYRAERPNRDTYVFFCHYGITILLLSHLINVSPMTLWHGIVLAPTSVTSIYTEERRKGIASFRANTIGDTYHLYAGGAEPSFQARFCETYDSGERRD